MNTLLLLMLLMLLQLMMLHPARVAPAPAAPAAAAAVPCLLFDQSTEPSAVSSYYGSLRWPYGNKEKLSNRRERYSAVLAFDIIVCTTYLKKVKDFASNEFVDVDVLYGSFQERQAPRGAPSMLWIF
jgi:hypothetical protein